MDGDPELEPGLRRESRWAPFVVVVLGLALSLGAWSASSATLSEVRDTAFASEMLKIDAAIQSRFAAYEQVLRGGLALWYVEPNVTREMWRTYVDNLDLGVNYPGIQGVGYAQFFDEAELDAHEAAVRAEGYPDYMVHDVNGSRPAGPRYTSIVYLEPFDTRNRAAHGLDMYSHPERRRAMDRAIDLAVPALSGRVILVQEIDEDVQPGFLLYMAHYAAGMPTDTVEERRAAVLGFVYAPFRAHDLMSGILGRSSVEVSYEVYDQEYGPSHLLFDEDGRAQSDQRTQPLRSGTGALEVAGRVWRLQYATTPAFEARFPGTQPLLILVGGLVVTGLVAGVTYSLSRTQQHAWRMARRMTSQLRQSEREKARLAQELARSNSDLEQFAYLASHDLQEPARTIQAYLGLIEEDYGDRLGDQGRRLLQTTKDGARRMRDLVQSLLEYSRVGRDPYPPAPIDADRALDSVLEQLRAALDESGARVRRDPLPAVWMRQEELVRVFMNLIGNALKYRSEQPPRIDITVGREGDKWLFQVRDNGIGLDPQHAERIFAMFTRLHAEDRIRGSGMGLAIAKKAVESVGGRIWVESRPHEGATFKFELPVEGPA